MAPPRNPQRFGRFLRASVVCASLLLPLAGHAAEDHELEEAQERIDANPKDPHAWLLRADLYRSRREWAAAAADLEKAASLDPNLPAADLGLAQTQLDAGEAGPARASVDRFLAKNPDHASGHLLKARILARLGDRNAASAEFTRGIDLAKKDGGAKGAQPDDYLARAGLEACNGDLDAAIRGLDEGVSALGDAVTLRMLAIEMEMSRERWDAALPRIAALESGAKRKETWISMRAQVLEEAGRREEAAKACREALSAVDALPEPVRHSPATRLLADKMNASLERLSKPADAAAMRAKHPSVNWCK